MIQRQINEILPTHQRAAEMMDNEDEVPMARYMAIKIAESTRERLKDLRAWLEIFETEQDYRTAQGIVIL